MGNERQRERDREMDRERETETERERDRERDRESCHRVIEEKNTANLCAINNLAR